MKEEALDRTVLETRFGRGYGPVIRQTRNNKTFIFQYWLCRNGRSKYDTPVGLSFVVIKDIQALFFYREVP